MSARPLPADVPLILALIRELAEYEHLSDQVFATEADLQVALFGERPAVEAVVGSLDGVPAGFGLFFKAFSTFLGRPGLYLEDLFARAAARGRGLERAIFLHLARLAVKPRRDRFEWSVLDWNQPAISFYRRHGAVVRNGVLGRIGAWRSYQNTSISDSLM